MMKAMELNELGEALDSMKLPDRQPGVGDIRVNVAACGVCLYCLDSRENPSYRFLTAAI
jgi:D-arabinose 1-dehydrogenase-like Zn-dependent alcohol dehydrogenase